MDELTRLQKELEQIKKSPIHSSWLEKSKEEILDALKWQGMITKELLEAQEKYIKEKEKLERKCKHLQDKIEEDEEINRKIYDDLYKEYERAINNWKAEKLSRRLLQNKIEIIKELANKKAGNKDYKGTIAEGVWTDVLKEIK